MSLALPLLFRTPFPSPSLHLSFFLTQLTTFRCLLSREALLISRSFHHLFPARAVVDDDFTLSSRKLRINVDHQFAATESSRAYHGRCSRISNFRRRIFLILSRNAISRLRRDIKVDSTLMHFQRTPVSNYFYNARNPISNRFNIQICGIFTLFFYEYYRGMKLQLDAIFVNAQMLPFIFRPLEVRRTGSLLSSIKRRTVLKLATPILDGLDKSAFTISTIHLSTRLS